jgi:Protein of unknown function (DUF3237)
MSILAETEPPSGMKGLVYEHLFSIRADLKGSLDAGDAALGRRVLNAVDKGTFEGPRLKGEINPGTGDWMLVRRDNTAIVDARIVLRTDDGALIHMSYGGRIAIPAEILGQARDPERRHLLDPTRYYFRTTPVFETGAEKYAWLNNVVCVGSGRLLQGRAVAYEVFQIL